jgi:hypothetical protein
MSWIAVCIAIAAGSVGVSSSVEIARSSKAL